MPNERGSERPGHDCPHPRLLGHPTELGALDHPLREQGLPRDRARLSRVRGRGRGPQPGSHSDRGAHGPRRRRAPREDRRRARQAADPRRPLRRRNLRAAPPRPRLRRRRRAINSAPTEGVRVTPPAQIKSLFPALKNPANRHRAVGFTHEQWHYAFTNTFSEEESRALYERYHIPASGAILFGIVLANFQPGHQASWVDYKNDDRAPLLFISGSEDNLMPPKVQQSNAKHYTSDTLTAVKEYEGYAHSCRRRKAGRRLPTTRSSGPSSTLSCRPCEPGAHHAHRWADDPDRGRGLAAAHGPDVRPSGRELRVRLGLGLAQADRAGRDGGRDRAGRRSAGEPRPPRRQSRRRRAYAPACNGSCGHDRVRGPSGSAAAPGAGALGDDAARSSGATVDRDHGHAQPPRPSSEPSGRGRRDRLRAALEGSGARSLLDHGRHRPLPRCGAFPSASRSERCSSTWAACASG